MANQTGRKLSSTGSDCECPVDPKVLFGPGQSATSSHQFLVADKPVLVDVWGLEDGASILFTRHVVVCGSPFEKEALDMCGSCYCADHHVPQVLITVPGKYRAHIHGGQDPEDIAAVVCEVEAKVTITKECS